ncbi:hypothetical protein [uncultured Aquimarina sp.]|uniref:hypothetical protein n=1 Tax=uncultured Aquimarina sp. TaxID=575652 RepID=UPI002621DBFF|nr:hypothetical protein [uncultured Aquimarina sp.]
MKNKLRNTTLVMINARKLTKEECIHIDGGAIRQNNAYCLSLVNRLDRLFLLASNLSPSSPEMYNIQSQIRFWQSVYSNNC